jgi:hypothetical protein
VRIAQEADYLGHGGLEDTAIFRMCNAVHGQGVAVGEEGRKNAVSAWPS